MDLSTVMPIVEALTEKDFNSWLTPQEKRSKVSSSKEIMAHAWIYHNQ